MNKPLFIHQNQPDEKMVYLRVMNYRDSNAAYLVLVGTDIKDAGVPYRTITTKPAQDVPVFTAAVKIADKDLAELLIQVGLAAPTDEMVHAGFQSLYLLSLDRETLMEYDPEGTQDYESRIHDRKENHDNGIRIS